VEEDRLVATTKHITDEGVWDALGRRLFKAGIPPEPGWPTSVPFSFGYPNGHRNPTEHGSEDLELIWDFDFTPAQEEEWERLMTWARRHAGAEDPDRQGRIRQLKAYRKRGRPASTEDLERAIDEIIDLLED
jgi:hypothetical protein